jgi:predicted acetyltransferase
VYQEKCESRSAALRREWQIKQLPRSEKQLLCQRWKENMMDELEFVLPSIAYGEEIVAYRQEFLDCGDSMDGTGPLRRSEDPAAYIAQVQSYADPATVPEGKVQATQFCCIRKSDGMLVGMLQVRHCLNAYLEQYAGHIGYSVRPSQRRKGYATWMLRNALPFCKSIGLDRVMVSCIDTNEGSRKTILACGGVYESTVYEPDEKINLQRYWITLT